MATSTNRCLETGLSVSYAYKKGCRCADCRANKAKDTKNDAKAVERARLWIKDHPDARRGYNKRYRELTWLTKYNELRKTQEDCCAICSSKTSVGTMSNGNKLCIDHDHITGKLRGLLCGACNIGIGHFNDKPELLIKAANYLRSFNV